MTTTLWMVIIGGVSLALIFDVINGFHDSANSIATVVSTRVLSPREAVLWAALFNFVALFVFAPHVANTIANIVKITPSDHDYVYVVLSGLVGAIVWDLLTWAWGLPTSSSHALIGAVAGAGIAHQGMNSIQLDKILPVIRYIVIAPVMGFFLGYLIMLAVFWTFRRMRPMTVDRIFRRAQLFSAMCYSLGHGGNDAQKTMGIIVALLVAAGIFKPGVTLSLKNPQTIWIMLACNGAMALGTAFGGWRIVKTMGMKITKLKPVGGFCAETAGSITLFLATGLGVPISTTHTITGAIMGVGATTKLSGIKWGVAKRIVWAWVLTIPLSGLVAACCFHLIQAARHLLHH